MACRLGWRLQLWAMTVRLDAVVVSLNIELSNHSLKGVASELLVITRIEGFLALENSVF